ncbi:MAG TPA: bifunctional DNA-formamidopyrimidine glycosylase/DNA-(apurinic or apyrimidinic site) lyase [Propionibacteriaceae bacterium]|nr:bifunctional DNA-formamidopyrimidine glycosylase/DNA-(apurinic or apyrimidinic site) lyase [Propionibacteriaceae bacterium]
MPELPEVETVRSGLAGIVTGRTVLATRVLHPRPVRRHLPGPDDFEAALVGRTFGEPRRRGKFLWLPLDDGDAVVAHLGMSGQFRSDLPDAPLQPNTRILWDLDDGRQLRFVDQRMFGGVWLSAGGAALPAEISHIALDPFDPAFDPVTVAHRMVRRSSGVKRLILDQTIVSGIGNIYADESLWRARIHWNTPGSDLSVRRTAALLRHAQDVMAASLVHGGTSFDRLYVDVNGSSGYHERSLEVYGREGLPCSRCGRPVVREAFANRSSYRCPSCQRLSR